MMKLLACALLVACDMGSPQRALEPPPIEPESAPAPARRVLTEQRIAALDRCAVAVSGAPSTVVGAVVKLDDGSTLETRAHALERGGYPFATAIPPRTNYVDAEVDGDDALVTIRDERGPFARYRFPVAAYPVVHTDGTVGSTGRGSRCAMGIADHSWWDISGDAIISVHYSISDLCDGRVRDICSLAVVAAPKDLPTRD